MIRHRLTARVVWARLAVLLVAAGLIGVPTAAAAEEQDAAVSWSVSPADGTGPDGRISIEHELDPGESVDDSIAVRNLGAEEVVFRLSAADGYYTSSGRFDMLTSDRESVAAGTWISIPAEVVVPAGGMVIVPFTIAVPANAEPGDHAAGVAASVLSIQDGEGTGVGVESRVGVKVMTRVTGDLTPAFVVKDVQTEHRMSWNPFRAGSVAVAFTVENTGNARLDAIGTLHLAGQDIAFPSEGERRQELLPGESRSFAIVVDEVWPLFAVTGDIHVAPTAVALDGGTFSIEPENVPLFVWAVPWPHLLLVAGVTLILLALLWNRIRSRRRMEGLIEKAVELGRAQAREESRGQEETA